MTTHNFSLDRLCMLLRWNWTNSRRQTLRIGMILSAFTGVAYTFILRLVQRKYIYANDISRLPDMVGTFVIAIVLRVLPLILCAMGALIFSNMETKPMREHYLMLPASHAEKYATRFIHITLGSVLTFAVALVVGDVIQFALSFIFHPGIHHSCLWDMIRCFITGSGNQQLADCLLFRDDIAATTIAYSGLLWLHSYCTLGGTLLRRHPTACVALSLLLLSTAVSCSPGIFDIFPRAISPKPTVGVTTAVAAVLIGLSIANYVGSYRIFKRMQIICDKFTNL